VTLADFGYLVYTFGFLNPKVKDFKIIWLSIGFDRI
jgi:hypothetical protein